MTTTKNTDTEAAITVSGTNVESSYDQDTFDANVVGNVKTKDYTESDLADGYSFLVTDTSGDIEIKFYKDGTLVKTYTFTNSVTFAS